MSQDNDAYTANHIDDMSGYAPAIVNNEDIKNDIDIAARTGTDERSTLTHMTTARACQDRFKGSGATAGHHAICTT
ncbi:MAG: hypothetical protein AAB906_02990 [Patescibacteria group bacterium]